jgi:HAD superfamily hydrolase (TIGR01509 family)
MDGVLLDTSSLIWNSFLHSAQKHGFDLSKEKYENVLGISFSDCIPRWEKEHGVTIDSDSFRKTAVAHQFENIRGENILIPGVQSFLDGLKMRKIPMAIATTSHPLRAQKYLEAANLSSYVEVIITSRDVQRHKPFPDVFLCAAEKLSIEPSRCVVVEDAPVGILAGHRAGMKVIGMTTPPATHQLLREADLIVSNFSQLSYETLVKLAEK